MNIWQSIKFSALGPGVSSLPVHMKWRDKEKGPLTYRGNKMYRNIYVFAAKRALMNAGLDAAKALLPSILNIRRKALRQKALQEIDTTQKDLIKRREVVIKNYGEIVTKEGDVITAIDRYGNKVPEAIMLYYHDVKPHPITRPIHTSLGTKYESGETATYFFFDPTAIVTMSSTKNMVMTAVQGRDHSRKELISGGDLKFTVTGNIVGNEYDLYPAQEVKKFIQIMQYPGVINVNHYLLDQFNVRQLIITDYSLEKSDFQNVQPYSLSCVAVEPADRVKVTEDTISSINGIIAATPKDAYWEMVLKDRLQRIAENASQDILVNGVATGIDMSINTI